MANRPSSRRKEKYRRIEAWRSADDALFQKTGLPREALIRLESELVGKIVLPGSPEYNQDRQESNPAFQAYPQIIVYCAVESDIAWCLSFAKENNLWVCVRSGGHSTAGFSVNDGMLIDVSELSSVAVDTVNQTATVGAGTDFDTLNGALNTTGLHVPSGACGDVCVGGFVQGGGYGYTSRCFGMQCDSVLAFRVMLANGGIVVANSTTNSDLYWAMRGGTGGNFGILLSVTYQLYAVPTVWAYSIQWNIGDAPAALLEMQTNYMRTGAPPQLGAMINLGFNTTTTPPTPVLLMQGMYVGTAAAGKQALSSLLSLGSAVLNVDISGPYGSMDLYLDTHPYTIPNPPDGSSEAKRAGYISNPLTLQDWKAIVQYELTAPNPNDTLIIEPYGGAINQVPKAATAFVHRDVAMDMFVDVFWLQETDKAREVAWLNGFMNLLAPFMTGKVYQNYPYRDLEMFGDAYWGDAYGFLMQVKAKYDPTNFFRFKQSLSGDCVTPAPGQIVYAVPPPPA
ncbi:MAG TPA: FAD-binding oxidoreductase [Vicinamibacterales bacterium]|jgi:FAD/FMN-containing dehydrogenase|nr:FAD-binding oxidoreductase [Vicinamibacterales bacterium]